MFYAKKNFIRRLSRSVFSYFGIFTLEMCVATQNREKFSKNPILVFKVTQGHRC